MPRRIKPAGGAGGPTVGAGRSRTAAGGLVFEKGGLLCFAVRVQPRSARLGFAGFHGDALKVQLTAPPAENRANRQLIEFVASQLGVSKSSVRLVSGPRSRDKTLGVEGLERVRLESLLEGFNPTEEGRAGR